MSKNKKETKKRNSGLAITILIFAFAFLISIGCYGSIFYYYKSDMKYIAEGVQSTLLATGLSIIGLAIAVWSGLSIVTVIQKKEINELEEKVKKITPDAEKIIESYNEQLVLNYRTLLFSLSETNDIMCNYLKNKFVSIEYDILNATDNSALSSLLFYCNQIEIMFQQVYHRHYNLNFNSNDNFYGDIIRNIDEATETMEKANINSTVKNVLQMFLNIKKADIEFYFGYEYDTKNMQNLSEELKHNIIKRFKNAIEIYLKEFPKIDASKIIQKMSFSELFNISDSFIYKTVNSYMNVKLYVYMCNAIGEAYSKIIEIENILDIITNDVKIEHWKNAVYYFEIVYKTITNSEYSELAREIYFRNYGFALKRINFQQITTKKHCNLIKVCEHDNKCNENTICLKDICITRIKECFNNSLYYAAENKDIKLKTIRGLYLLYQDFFNENFSTALNNPSLSKELSEMALKTLAYLEILDSSFNNGLDLLKWRAIIYMNLIQLNDCEKEEYVNEFIHIVKTLKIFYKSTTDKELISINEFYENGIS